MSTVVGFPHLETTREPNAPGDELVRRQVWGVLTAMYPQGRVVERRLDQRYPYPHFFYLTPVAANGISPEGESTVVVGKTLSERGLAFFYQQPLAHRRMIASLETSELRWAGFLIDITWCRFTQYGWYDSGGRFVQAVPSPIERPVR
ncbi:MAG: hypothetical protein WD063_19800 [Pirellulales bacterium]